MRSNKRRLARRSSLVTVSRRYSWSFILIMQPAFNLHGREKSLLTGTHSQRFTSSISPECALPLRSLSVAASTPWTLTVPHGSTRSEEHTSELQSHLNLVCRLLLEKKK